MRKFARVGRPWQALGEQRADLGSSSAVVRSPAASATTSSSSRCSSARCQASRGAVAVERVGGRGERRRPARRSAAARAARRAPRCSRSTQLGEAAGEVDRAALDVVERQHAVEQPRLVLGHRHAEQHAVQAGPPGAGGQLVELERRAVRGVEAPADPALGDPVLQPREVVVVEPEAPADRLAVGEVEHLRGGQPLLGELEQPRDDAEHRVGLAQRAVGEPDAQVGRPVRRGHDPSSSSSSAASPAPNVAWISGANVSMSGHITITSRGSSVGSSASRCRIASRSTSTWRARPWQAWTCDAAVARRRARASRPGGAAVRARTSAWMRASSVSVAVRDRVVVVGAAVAAEHELQLARVVAPRGEQAVGRQRRGRVVARGGTAGARGAPRPLPQRGRRVQQEQVDVARLGERAQHLEVAGGQPRQAEQRDARRERHQRRARRAAARTPPRAARPGRARRSARAAAATAPPASRRPGAALARRPVEQQLGPVQRVAVEQPGEVADGGEAAAARRRVVAPAEVAREAAQPRLAQRLADDLEQRPHRAARAATGRPPARRRRRPRPRRRSAAAGSGNSTFAQIAPSRRVGEPLGEPALHPARRHARRPRRRTDPPAASASSPRSASTRPSARSARWTWSIHRMVERAADVLTQLRPSSFFLASTSMPCSRARFSPRILRLAWSVSCG